MRCPRPGVTTLLSSLVWMLLLAAAAPAQPGPDRHYVYQLNHISTANAIKVLKTLNYQVVDVGSVGTTQVDSGLTRPVVVELPDADTTTNYLTEFNPESSPVDLKGPVAGVPQQRLLIVWDQADAAALDGLLRLLYESIDVPARQILIEGLVLELDRDRVKDLGLSARGSKDGQQFGVPDAIGEPFFFIFNRPTVKTLLDLTVTLTALVEEGSATVLSRPSVLVLDGRQARIHVGTSVPYTSLQTFQNATTTEQIVNTSWVKVGIGLNLLPRATADGSEVAMKVQIGISNAGGATPLTGGVLGPPVDNSDVETVVRVANDSPFVIGGLISANQAVRKSGLPLLSKIPGLGRLFNRKSRSGEQREILIVVTPHVLPLAERTFGFGAVKDTGLLDHFDLALFRNTYRIRGEDVLDTGFVLDSDLYRGLRQAADRVARDLGDRAVAAGWPPVPPGDRDRLAQQMRRAVDEQPDFLAELLADLPEIHAAEPLIEVVAGGFPGEDVLVRQMLLGMIEKLEFGRHVDPQKIAFLEDASAGAGAAPVVEIRQLLPRLRGLGGHCRTLSLAFEARTPAPAGSVTIRLDPPTARVDDGLTLADDAAYVAELRRINQRGEGGERDRAGLLFNGCYQRREQSTLRMLQNVLAVEHLLELNPILPLTLDAFHPGREIVFPDPESLGAANHVVDRRTAVLFYQAIDYYFAFEQELGLAYSQVMGIPGTI